MLSFNEGMNITKNISGVQFSTLSVENIMKMSVFKNKNGIDVIELYENSEPKIGSLIDSRMGTTSNDILCSTCGFNVENCIGHNGHIYLHNNIFIIGYLKFVIMTLQCICLSCSKIRLPKNKDALIKAIMLKAPKERLAYVKNICKNVRYCQAENGGCGAPLPTVRRIPVKGGIQIVSEIGTTDGENDKKKKAMNLSADLIYEIFRKVSYNDCLLLGFDPKLTRPNDFITDTLIVPPIAIRPSSRGDFSGGISSEDDLTRELGGVIRHVLRINKMAETNNENLSKYRNDYKNLTQIHVATYMIDEKAGGLQESQGKKVVKGLESRIEGKTGIFRNNLEGKRIEFTARSVITSQPSIRNNQICIPVMVAKNLSIPVRVGPHNIKELQELVKRGKEYPGANYVFQYSKVLNGNSTKVPNIYLGLGGEAVKLNYGDVVERHLINGDTVLLNRQPTLHKQSMMAFNIVVVNNPNIMTIGMSVDITTSYNADFDGDEMNLFLPQSIQAIIELEEIALAEKQIISPSTSKTANGTKQDGLVGSYLLSDGEVVVPWRHAMNLMAYTTQNVGNISKTKDMKGNEVYSEIIPKSVNMNGKVKIENGMIKSGRIGAGQLGAQKEDTLTQMVWELTDIETTEKFVDNVRWLANSYNLDRGFSLGYGDLDFNKKVNKEIDVIFDTAQKQAEFLITENETTGLKTSEELESELYGILSKLNKASHELVKESLSNDNAFKILLNCGSKGKAENIGQMVGCLGMQAFDGKLMPKKYNGRTLPYYTQHEDLPESRGLIRKSLYEGASFANFVYVMVNGRSGLIDQAVKTAPDTLKKSFFNQ